MRQSLLPMPCHSPLCTHGDGHIIYMTAEQLVRANRESITPNERIVLYEEMILGRGLAYPVAAAFRAVSTVDGVRTEYTVLFFYFSARMNARGGKIVTLCITPDMWQEIVNNPAISLD